MTIEHFQERVGELVNAAKEGRLSFHKATPLEAIVALLSVAAVEALRDGCEIGEWTLLCAIAFSRVKTERFLDRVWLCPKCHEQTAGETKCVACGAARQT
jgi:hypothetical protein